MYPRSCQLEEACSTPDMNEPEKPRHCANRAGVSACGVNQRPNREMIGICHGSATVCYMRAIRAEKGSRRSFVAQMKSPGDLRAYRRRSHESCTGAKSPRVLVLGGGRANSKIVASGETAPR